MGLFSKSKRNSSSSRQSSILSNVSAPGSKRNSLFRGKGHSKVSPSPSAVNLGHLDNKSTTNSTAHSSPVLSTAFVNEPEPIAAPPPPPPAHPIDDVSTAPTLLSAPALERTISTSSTSSSDSFHSARTFSEADLDNLALSSTEPSAVLASSQVPSPGASGQLGAEGEARVARHVEVAQRAMNEPHKEIAPLGKPLTSLTAKDVAMTEESMAEDVFVVRKALHLFMSSRMVEAEEVCLPGIDHKMYYSLGYSLIQALKSLATFEEEDLEHAIDLCRNTSHITQLVRKTELGWIASASRLAKGSTSLHAIKSMNAIERNAELVFAECTLLKAVLGIIYSGDFVAFLKEALNMRQAYGTYRNLAKFIETADATHPAGLDPSIDENIRSGVELGAGLISLILSLLPGSVLKIVEVFGFTGDRDYALRTLMKPGGWVTGVAEPTTDPEKEGLRRPIADLILLMYHLVIASYLPVGKVDIPLARSILDYNLARYPNSIFFLYYAGRLYSTETRLEAAIETYKKALASQKEYVQLGHICYWDLSLAYLALADWPNAYESLHILGTESNWSKAIYTYGQAISLLEQGKDTARAGEMMNQVPDLTQKIAGKSIPLEKFVARRAKKFSDQGQRLTLGGLEFAYVLNCLGLTPRRVLYEVHLQRVTAALAELEGVAEPSSWGQGDEYYDDLCLVHLLKGVILRLIAHPEDHMVPDPKESQIPIQAADESAIESFRTIFKYGPEVQKDHHLVWFAHYELGRLHQMMGRHSQAKAEFEQVLSGKGMELGTKRGKGKVSLQNMAVLRSNGALQTMREAGQL